MQNSNEIHVNIIDSQNNSTTDNNKNESKKRPREEMVHKIDSNKKTKLANSINTLNTSNSSTNINLNINKVAEIFLKIIEGNYILQEHYDIASGTEKSDKKVLSQNVQTPYKIEANINLSSSKILTIETNSVEDFYQVIAKNLLKDINIILLIEYFVSKNYDWKKSGKFNETILHYLITLPNIMLALDKFNIDIQRDLLQKYIDREFNNPLLVLAKLYAKNLNELYYENLKDCFKVIYDFDNDFVEYVHISLDSSSNSGDKSEENNLSTFDIVYERIDYVLSQDQITPIVKNYLEILAMMCVHTQDDEDFLLTQIKDTFKKYALKDVYLEKFDSYLKYYEQKDQALSHAEDELDEQKKALDEDCQPNSNINSVAKSTFFKEPDVINKQDVQSNLSSNKYNITHKFM